MVVIYGGRNDKDFKLNNNYILNDIFILSLKNSLTWINIDIYG